MRIIGTVVGTRIKQLRTDLHCHLLPGIDDGAKGLDQALAMARIAVADGIGTAVVTPHHLNGVYVNRAEPVRRAMAALQLELDAAGIALTLLPGNELHLTPETPQALADGTALTIADRGRAALVELPVHTVPVGVEHLLERIIAQHIVPVIAHPERNSELRQHPERLGDWVDMGCLGQVTAMSCTGQFGEPVRRAAEIMVRSGWIHVAASDAHRDRRRVPRTSIARQVLTGWVGSQAAELMIDSWPSALARGESIDTALLRDALPAPRHRRSLGRRLRRWLGG